MANIFVEGSSDVKFLTDFIKLHFDKKLIDSDFLLTLQETKGYGGLFVREDSINKLRNGTDNEVPNLVIFDADLKTNGQNNISNGGFINHQSEIFMKAQENNIELELFLYPNNHDDGDLETLLLQLANPEKFSPFEKCFSPYASCLQSYKDQYDKTQTDPKKKLRPFNQSRSKIAVYNYLKMHRNSEDNIAKTDYTDPEFWNINDPSGKPLRDFLAPYFS